MENQQPSTTRDEMFDLAVSGSSSDMAPVSLEKLAKFQRLIDEIISGDLRRRSRFDAWEVDLLLDIASSNLTGGPAARRQVLRQYQKAAYRRMEEESDAPLKLSEYLKALKTPVRSARSARAGSGQTE
jgi:hypothetical protein